MIDIRNAVYSAIAGIVMLLMCVFSANANPRYDGPPRHPPRGHCCGVSSNDNHVAKSMALVAVGLAVIAVMVSIEASESNKGQVVITRF